jgi:hypothetical protein
VELLVLGGMAFTEIREYVWEEWAENLGFRMGFRMDLSRNMS